MAPLDPPVYLDHAATSPLRPEALEAMLPWLGERFGNPSSLHRWGRDAREAITKARELVADFLSADAEEIVFTSGGTEANNHAVRALAGAGKVCCSAVEHPSVLRTVKSLGGTILPVDVRGIIDLSALRAALSSHPALVSVMAANNETGVLQPIDEVARLCEEHGVPLHVDATQSAWLAPLDLEQIPVALMTVSAHKLGGPKGAGALYVRHGVGLAALLTGGNQERRRRAGTENVSAIVAFGAACKETRRKRDAEATRLMMLRDEMAARLLESCPGLDCVGIKARRLPHILNVIHPSLEGENLVRRLDAEGVAVSTGAACSSGQVDPSHVLLAMGSSHEAALRGIRISLGWSTTAEEIEAAIPRIMRVLSDGR